MEVSNNFDIEMWWSIAKQCRYATFFHTPLWHQLATTTYPNYKDATVFIRFKSGKEAILPLLNVNANRMLFKQLQSTFAGCYGDLICKEGVEPNERAAIYEYLSANQFVHLQIIENPFGMNNLPPTSFNQTNDFTQVLKLEDGFDEILSNFSQGHRRSYRKGCNMGVRIRNANRIEDYKEYFKAYKDSLKRWGDNASSNYPWKLFEKGFYLAEEFPNNIQLWLAEVDKKIIAGAWAFYWNQHVVYWHGAAYEAFFNHYPNHVLQTEIIKDALKRGFKYYDFNPSGGHTGVIKFKERFGAERRPFTRITISSPLIQFGKKIKQWVQ